MKYSKEEMRNMLSNPLFRAANEQLCKVFEKELKEAEAEERLVAYLKDHQNASFAQVVMETGVDMKIIENLIADGRIDIKITKGDRDAIDKLQAQMRAELARLGAGIKEDKAKQDEALDAERRASGMYSKKDGKLK